MDNLILFFVKFAVRMVGIMPFRLIYIISGFFSFIFIKITNYRKKTILQNLANSFPKKTENERKAIAKAYYRHLSDILLESVKGLTLTKAELQRRFVYKNPEIFDQFFDKKQSVFLLGSHYGNWEWGSLSFPLAVRHKVVGIYKPIKNVGIERYLNTLRRRWGLHLTNLKNTGRSIIENKNQPTIFVLIADQTPSDIRNAHWVNFLNQDTPFLHGADKLAHQTGYPVFHFRIKKIRRGFYEVWFEEISTEPNNLKEGAITQLYAKRLEKMIENDPPNWLWSHRRWKRKRKK